MKNKNLNKLILSKVLLLMLDHKEIGQIEIAILKKTTNKKGTEGVKNMPKPVCEKKCQTCLSKKIMPKPMFQQ
jgi:uncharacterized protein YrzB (UPF0473 family)